MRRACVRSVSWQQRHRDNHYTVNDFFRPQVTGKYDIPVLERCDHVPIIDLYPYDKLKHYPKDAVPGQYALHLFMGDEMFQKAWLSPSLTLPPVQRVGLAITPDFSLYSDWTYSVQLWQTYRTRWLGAYWASEGVQVIPSVSWSDERSFDFCFDGLPEGGTFAIATMELAEAEAVPLFKAGLIEFILRCQPTTLLVYGKGFKGFIEDAVDKYSGGEVRRYLSRMDHLKKKLADKKLAETLSASERSRAAKKSQQVMVRG